MIIRNEEDVTAAVLAEMHRTPDARTKELLASLVRHLHAFVKETRLTEREFQQAIGYLNAIGQKTTPSHNEAMLIAGALGVSNLVCLVNNAAPTQANNLGPFYRAGAPRCEDGASLVRLDRGVPGLVVDGAHGIVAAQMRIGARPARGGGDVPRMRGGNEDLRHHAVGLQRDRREHRVELALVVGSLRLGDVDEEQGSQQRGADGKDDLHGAMVAAGLRPVCPNM